MTSSPAAFTAIGGRALDRASLREDVLRQFRIVEELCPRLPGDRLGILRRVARDIIRWMDEWLSDREHGGFYASQDADYSMDDDGDYFTWTPDEVRAVLRKKKRRSHCATTSTKSARCTTIPEKNVLYMRASSRKSASG